MGFRMAHLNFNVVNLKESLEFYYKLGMKEVRRHEPEDSSFIICFLEDEAGSDFKLELTWMRDHPEKYDLGEEEFLLGFYVSNYEEVKQEVVNRSPLSRMGDATDLTGACMFLCENGSSWLTGQTIVVDGGTSFQ